MNGPLLRDQEAALGLDRLPPPPRVRLRQRRHACSTYIRKVKGNLYQLRWWLEHHGSVNCGLYDECDAELVRGRLASESRHHPATPLGLWRGLVAVLDRLTRERPGSEWPRPLPLWVRRRDGGYCGRVRRAGRLVECGPYPTPEDAHRAVRAALGLADAPPAPAASWAAGPLCEMTTVA